VLGGEGSPGGRGAHWCTFQLSLSRFSLTTRDKTKSAYVELKSGRVSPCLAVSSHLRKHLQPGAVVVTVDNVLQERAGFRLRRTVKGPNSDSGKGLHSSTFPAQREHFPQDTLGGICDKNGSG